ncbi:MAG: hypothetical protein SFY95_01135 [Planctomycetota bacterium]|nr:hypothetical protein [Planctomycetota bacterium]
MLVLGVFAPSIARAQSQGGGGNPSEGETQIPEEVMRLQRLLDRIWLTLFSRTDPPDAMYSLSWHPDTHGQIVSGWNSDGEPFLARIDRIRHIEFESAACTAGVGLKAIVGVKAAMVISAAGGTAAAIAEGATSSIGYRALCLSSYINCKSYCSLCEEVCEGQILQKWCAWPQGHRWDPAPFPLP